MSEPVEIPLSTRSATSARPTTSGDLAEKVRSLRLSDAAEPEHRPRRNWFPWLLVLAFAGSTGFLAYRIQELNSTQAASRDGLDPQAKVVSSTGVTAEAGSIDSVTSAVTPPGSVVLESKGYIVPAHQILLTPKVSGMVVKLFIEEGKRVKKGDELARLETTDYQADFDRVTAVLEATRNRLKELENGNRPEEIQQTRAELAEMTFQRGQLREAYQRAIKLRESRSISADEFERAESSFRAMESRVEKLQNAHDLMVKGPRLERILLARAEVQQAQADLVKAKWRLDNCTILSPISGTILTKKAEEGNMVNPVAFSGSQALCELADLSDLEVDLSIQERDVSKVFKGQKCIVRAEAFPSRPYNGTVARLMPIADRAKGAIPVRVKLQVPDEEEGVYLKPEMGAVVTFYSKEEPRTPARVPAPSGKAAQPPKSPPTSSSSTPAPHAEAAKQNTPADAAKTRT